MYGVLTPCGDCGGAHYDCGARDPSVCPDCDSTFVEVADEDGTPQGLACPLCHLEAVQRAGGAECGAEYDFSPPVIPADDVGF